jgi:hypothetical protein
MRHGGSVDAVSHNQPSTREFRGGIDESMRLYDKLLIVLSKPGARRRTPCADV